MIHFVHYVIAAMLIGGAYWCFKASLRTTNPWQKIRADVQMLKTRSRYLHRFLSNPTLDRSFREAGLPVSVTSVKYNLFRHTLLIVVVSLKLLEGWHNIQNISSTTVLLVIFLYVLTMPLPYDSMPLQYVFRFLKKKHMTRQNDEVYSLYHLLKAEFKLDDKYIPNMYHLLKKNRRYFRNILPALDSCLNCWQEGAESAWSLFALRVGTKEAGTLADLMKEVETSGHQQARHLLEQKRQEFANANYNDFKDYLDHRKILMFVMVVICSLSILLFFAVPHIIEYRAIMEELNHLHSQ